MIGNSRLHWAWFVGATLQKAWDTHHLPAAVVEQLTARWASGSIPSEILPLSLVSLYSLDTDTFNRLPLYLASVVPAQTTLWQTYPATRIITLDYLPLKGLYPTLGI